MSCCNPCNTCCPCNAVEVTFPGTLQASSSVTNINFQHPGNGIYAEYSGPTTGYTGILGGGGGGVLCCCPNNLILPITAAETNPSQTFTGHATIPLCGNLTTVSGTLNYYTITSSVTGSAQVTCNNGVKSVRINSLNVSR